MAPNRHDPETRPSLILRLKNPDDMLAWQEFVEIYQPIVGTLAIRKGLQKADADDVTQEVLVRVAKHIEEWHEKPDSSSFRAWLATITRNQTIQFFRKRGRHAATGLPSELECRSDQTLEKDFDLEQNRQLFAWAARRVQKQFKDKTWKAFWLTAVTQNSIAETANLLNTTIAQVYVSRSRVMKALKTEVQKSEFDSRIDWSTP